MKKNRGSRAPLQERITPGFVPHSPASGMEAGEARVRESFTTLHWRYGQPHSSAVAFYAVSVTC